jgi:hypothetical protein
MAATATYSGPSVQEMLTSHAFAKEVITRQNGVESQRIFDDTQLVLLRRWCTGASAPDEILDEQNFTDAVGDKPGTKAIEKGSLVGLLIANSLAGNDLITKEEFEQLREWFEQN